MPALADYLQTHLAGAYAGADLLGRSAPGQRDPEIGAALRAIHEQVAEERDELRSIMAGLDIGESRLLVLVARTAERIGRLKPNGSLLHRTSLTDLVEVEALRDAVAAKIAGWQALLAIVDDVAQLDRVRLESLLEQGRTQHNRLTDVHAIVARRALV